ncbi:MAG TPA: hypothetical protein VFB12_10665 [Ktedonobacteraceae bacterium]|nr:hypothetical protein [Ktedonobacteraceae bacterium]
MRRYSWYGLMIANLASTARKTITFLAYHARVHDPAVVVLTIPQGMPGIVVGAFPGMGMLLPFKEEKKHVMDVLFQQCK